MNQEIRDNLIAFSGAVLLISVIVFSVGAFAKGRSQEKVTFSEFSHIEVGSTYEQARALVGFDGVEQSSNEIGGIKTVMYQWQNPDGSNMNAMYQNGKLVQKAQFGLK